MTGLGFCLMIRLPRVFLSLLFFSSWIIFTISFSKQIICYSGELLHRNTQSARHSLTCQTVTSLLTALSQEIEEEKNQYGFGVTVWFISLIYKFWFTEIRRLLEKLFFHVHILWTETATEFSFFDYEQIPWLLFRNPRIILSLLKHSLTPTEG